MGSMLGKNLYFINNHPIGTGYSPTRLKHGKTLPRPHFIHAGN
jgi:hypothetical protein